MKQSKGKYLLVLISMCGIIATSVGLITNVAGLFFTPVADDFGVMKGSVSLTLTIANLCFAFGGIFAPRLLKEENLKKLLIIGTAIIAGCTALLGVSGNLVLMYILNGLRGFTGGILGFVFITMVINNWFEASVALVTSIAMSCSGLAGALFSPIVSNVIESSGWRMGYFAVAAIMVVLNLPAILFLPSINPKSKGLVPYGYTGEKQAQAETKDQAAQASEISKVLFIAVIFYAIMGAGATALPQHFPGISGNYGMAASVGAMMLSICMIANSGGKILLGALIDRIGTRLSVLLFGALVIVGALMMLIIHTPFSMYAGAALYGLVYSLGTVALVSMTKDLFGLENYGRTYPTFSLWGTISNAVFSSLIGYMYDFSQGYTSTLILMAAMLGASIFIVISAYAKKA